MIHVWIENKIFIFYMQIINSQKLTMTFTIVFLFDVHAMQYKTMFF